VVTSGHVTKMAVTVTSFDPPYPNHHATCKLYGPMFYENRSYRQWKFYIAGIGIGCFYLFAPVTLTLTR